VKYDVGAGWLQFVVEVEKSRSREVEKSSLVEIYNASVRRQVSGAIFYGHS
jgi:hypothetical protein